MCEFRENDANGRGDLPRDCPVGREVRPPFLALGKYEKVKGVNGVVTIPLAKVRSDRARFYIYEADGKKVAFFLVQASDGTIRSAFDACDVCFMEKKGYEPQGDAMVCKNCNKRFAINRIGPNAAGGCNPAHLPHREAGGNVVIKVEDLIGRGKVFLEVRSKF